MDESMSPLGIISLLTFCFLVIMCECFYRRTNRKADMVVATPGPDTKIGENKVMVFTTEQIDKGVAAGIPLLVFDNLVLNLNGYEGCIQVESLSSSRTLAATLASFSTAATRSCKVAESSHTIIQHMH